MLKVIPDIVFHRYPTGEEDHKSSDLSLKYRPGLRRTTEQATTFSNLGAGNTKRPVGIDISNKTIGTDRRTKTEVAKSKGDRLVIVEEGAAAGVATEGADNKGESIEFNNRHGISCCQLRNFAN